jgi:hypothetical protein
MLLLVVVVMAAVGLAATSDVQQPLPACNLLNSNHCCCKLPPQTTYSWIVHKNQQRQKAQ